jgi:amino acid adenylation domain-containing protein
MVMASIRAPRSGAYVIQDVCESSEELDLPTLQLAWRRVSLRHPALRSSIEFGRDDGMYQRVHEQPETMWQEFNWTDVTPETKQERLNTWLRKDWRDGFDFNQGVPMRFAFLRLKGKSRILIWTSHHVLLDGRSYFIVWRELFAIYDGLVNHTDAALPACKTSREYVEWLRKQDEAKPEKYWRGIFTGVSQASGYIVDRLHLTHKQSGERFRKERGCLSAEQTLELEDFASRNEITINTMVQGAWALLLSRYYGLSDVVLGVARAGRHSSLAKADGIVGVLMNTLPLRIDVPANGKSLAWLKEIRSRWIAMREFEHTPLEKVREWSGLPAGTQPFDTVVAYDHEPITDALRNLGGSWRHRNVTRVQRTDFPLTLVAYGRPAVTWELVYDSHLFGAETVARMAKHLRTLLTSFAGQTDCVLPAIKMLTEGEERWLMWECNQVKVRFARNECVHRLFEQQVERNPAKVALEDNSTPITYIELNQRTNRLARLLRGRGAGPGKFVAVCFKRSPDAVVAILATLKAGAAFLPLDPGLPRARLTQIFQDVRPLFVLCHEADSAALSAFGCEMLSLDRLRDELATHSPDNLLDFAKPADVAYAICTSGSTGRPKAIATTHASLMNHTQAVPRIYDISESDRRLQFASIGSDMFLAEIFNYLCVGATLVFCLDRQGNSLSEFLRLLDEKQITIAGLPSAWWLEWVSAMQLTGLALPRALRAVIVGMERVTPSAFMGWKKMVGNRIRLFNAYGPAEATVTSTVYEAGTSEWEGETFVPIGKPIANAAAYVLDSQGNPVPVGIPGELYIGGDGVGRGYLNAPQLTTERFLPDPFCGNPEGRLYRTGDIAFILPDGNLVFLGRADRQVKIRGFRVELEEIESVLAQHAGMRQCAVLLTGNDGRGKLAAYVSTNGGKPPTGEELRLHLSRHLPEYMVPAAFFALPQLPLTPSGKIDRESLPSCGVEELALEPSCGEPATDTEKRLAAIWREVLSIARVGATENFFDLGGNSLAATRLITLIQMEFGKELSLASLLAAPILARLAATIDRTEQVPTERRGRLVSIQPFGRRPPLYCVHGSARFRHLIRHLGEDQPFFGIPADADPTSLPVPYRVEDIASQALEMLREHQPTGPYLIGGWCHGGIIGYEMAQQLKAQGECVPLLVLFDSLNPAAVPSGASWRVLSGILRFHLAAMRGMKVRERLAYAMGRVRWEASLMRSRIWRMSYQLRRLFRKRVPDHMIDWLQIQSASVLRYQPKPYAGKVVLFRCEQISVRHYMDSTYGWGNLVEGGIEVIDLPGDHVAIFEEPVVFTLAHELSARLQSVTTA